MHLLISHTLLNETIMLNEDEVFSNDQDDHLETKKANAYTVNDEHGEEENDLKRSYLFGDAEMKPVQEGKGMGGESFGENNVTPSGDDKNNPSRDAGYSNAYFGRTEPLEEHPENSNFTPNGENNYQEGTADYDGQKQFGEQGPIDLSDSEKFIGDDDDKHDASPK